MNKDDVVIGEIYQRHASAPKNCVVGKSEHTCHVISDSAHFSKVPYAISYDDLGQRVGYDPTVTPEWRAFTTELEHLTKLKEACDFIIKEFRNENCTHPTRIAYNLLQSLEFYESLLRLGITGKQDALDELKGKAE